MGEDIIYEGASFESASNNYGGSFSFHVVNSQPKPFSSVFVVRLKKNVENSFLLAHRRVAY